MLFPILGTSRAHREAMLAIQAKSLVFLSERRISVLVLRQHVDDAVPHAGPALNAFGFIYNYHDGIPPFPFFRTRRACAGY